MGKKRHDRGDRPLPSPRGGASWWLLALLLALPLRAGAETPSPEEILAGVDRNFLAGGMEMFVRLTNQRPKGERTMAVLYVVRTPPDTAALLVVSPDHQKGITALRRGNEAWMHIPGEMQPRAVSLVQSVVGGVFTNHDLLPVDYSPFYTPTLLNSDKTAYNLQLLPKGEHLPFSRVAMRVNSKLLVPETVRYFTAGNRLFGAVEWSGLRRFGLLPPRPTLASSQSDSNPGYVSTLSIGQIRPRAIPSESLTLEFLPRLGTLLKESSESMTTLP